MTVDAVKDRTKTATTKALVVAYAATVPLANWMIGNVGTQSFPGGPHTIPVGFGWAAPSGVLAIGVALAIRDYLQRRVGIRLVLVAIAFGVALSYLINPAVAFASAVAFALGELADLAVFTPLARRRPSLAVFVSGVIGGLVDSFVFLQLAFGSSKYWQGQVLGKAEVAALAALVTAGFHALSVRHFARQHGDKSHV